jgi:hypothetical protein
VLSQLLDHMVAPEAQRRGTYGAMARGFHERFVATDPGAVHFGFNLEEVLRIQERTFGFELLHGVSSYRLDLPDAAGEGGGIEGTARSGPSGVDSRGDAPGSPLVRIDRVERFPPAVDRLWERARGRYPAALARDSRYLNWRYADCPDVRYALLVARRRLSRRLAGLAVFRLGWLHEPLAALVDWVIPGDSPGIFASLAGAGHALARDAGLPFVRAWLPPTSPDGSLLRALGYRPEPSPFVVSAWNDGTPERPIAALRTGWHYTMGDTDIF